MSFRLYKIGILCAAVAMSACVSNGQTVTVGDSVSDINPTPVQIADRRYTIALANFGETPLRAEDAEVAAAIGDIFEEVRVVIFTADNFGWFVSAKKSVLSDVEGPHINLFVSTLEQNESDSFEVAKAINEHGYYAYKDIITNYFTRMSVAEFSKIRASLMNGGFFEKAIAVDEDVRDLNYSECTFFSDRFFVEAVVDGEHHLIYRNECHEAFQTDFGLALPLIEIAAQNVSVLGDRLGTLTASFTTARLATEVGN